MVFKSSASRQTASNNRIPPTWISQLAFDGVIIVDLRGSVAGGLLKLTLTEPGVVEGSLTNLPGAFMPLHTRLGSPHRGGESWRVVLDQRNPQRTTTALNPALLAQSTSLQFMTQLHLAGRHLRGRGVTSGRDQNVQHIPVLVDGPPQVVGLPFDRDEHLVEMPFIPWPGPSATQLVREGLTEFAAPLMDGFVGDYDTTGQHHLLDLPQAEREPVVQSHTVADDLHRVSAYR